MIDMGTLTLGIAVDSAGAKRELSQVGDNVDSTGKKTETLGSKAKAAMKAFAAAYAVKALVDVTKAAVQAYAQFEQLEGGVDKIFGKEASDTVMKNAENAYKTAGMSANQYMEQVTSFSASLIQSLDGDTEKAASVADMAIADMSDNANTFGTSMESIQNAYQGFAKQNYTMLDNLKLGYGGTKQEMERLLADAEKLSGQEYDISNLNDVYEAIHVIQTEMNVTGTTAKEGATTIEGSFNQMKAAAENALIAIGSGEGLDKATSAFIKTAVQFAKNVIPRVVTTAFSIVKGIIKAIPKMLLEIADGINKFADTISKKDSKSFIVEGGKILLAFVKGLLKAIPALVKALWNLRKVMFQKLKEINLKEVGRNILQSLLNGFIAIWGKIKSWVADKTEWIRSKFRRAKDEADDEGTGHRIGLAEVPYDGYRAVLHKGETVLTAAETNKLGGALDAMTGNILTGLSALQSVGGGGTSRIELTVNLGGSKVAEQIYLLNRQGKLAMEG